MCNTTSGTNSTMEKSARDRLKAANRRSWHGVKVDDMVPPLMLLLLMACYEKVDNKALEERSCLSEGEA